MEYEYAWYFEIAKDADMAQDEEGNPSECYSKVSMSFKEPKSDETLEKMTPAMLKHIADLSKIPIDLIQPISKLKYMAETHEENLL